jgi:Sugar transferases involved in lipopolysaccharide synthesis
VTPQVEEEISVEEDSAPAPIRQGVYGRYVKRLLDFILSLIALLLFWWVLAIVAILVRVKLGGPVIFRQPRPGRDEKIFMLYKFRSMTDERDESGELLPDEIRLTSFGKKLRATSLDELPELFNILKGDMAIVGPRPQLVRDMVFMTPLQRTRHSIRPGLTGLAQVRGRNAITWDEKLDFDLIYLEDISFVNDARIVFETIGKVFQSDGVSSEGMETAEDLGDYLLRENRVSRGQYDRLCERASCIQGSFR